MAIATTNPTTGEVVKSFEPLTSAQIEQKLQLAAFAFRSHRRTSFADRAAQMIRAAEVFEKKKRRGRPSDDARNGQASEGGGGRSAEVRNRLPLLCGKR